MSKRLRKKMNAMYDKRHVKALKLTLNWLRLEHKITERKV
jgi:hypothetical protein